MKILVVDDERLARARLVRMLEQLPEVQVVGEADRGSTALQLIEQLAPELVMLDLEMPGLDGMAVAEKKGLPPIIFTTAHPGYAAQAFALDAVDYLVKPVVKDRLEQALAKARRRLQMPAPDAGRWVVEDGDTTLVVDVLQVEAFRATDKYTEFTYQGREVIVRDSLDALEQRFASLGFVRIHRSGLVRLDAIVSLERRDDVLMAKLRSGALVEVSRRRATELRERLQLKG